MMRRFFTLVCGLAAALSLSARGDITANDLVLVVNKQQPEGRRLAEAYAAARSVPEGRIIEVDIPDTVDIAREFYESGIAEPVRRQLNERQLLASTKCLVLFYGIPLRVREREATPQEKTEVDTILNPMIAALEARVKMVTTELEAIAMIVDPQFRVEGGLDTSDRLRDRILAADKAVNDGLKNVADEKQREELTIRGRRARAALATMPQMQGISTTRPATMPTTQQVDQWVADSTDPEARRQIRQTMYWAGNVYQMLNFVEMQKRALTTKQNESSVDSELACILLGNYDRNMWVINPYHHSNVAPQLKPKFIRTARIDGPTPQIAQRIFEDAIAVEQKGLEGDLVLDARGLSGKGGLGTYEYFDQSIRNAARFAAGATQLKTLFDNNPPLFPDGTSKYTAMYCGWYQVRKYSPTVKLVPGSIAYHVASYELVSLRSPIETGWCRGLMLDGADVTVGPVGEPYLAAFPPADEFFALLFTGKPTLVEAYWATIPFASWKMAIIGDPLYRPFAAKPVLQIDQLPEPLRKVAG